MLSPGRQQVGCSGMRPNHNLNVTVSSSLKYVTRPGKKSQKQTDFIDIE